MGEFDSAAGGSRPLEVESARVLAEPFGDAQHRVEATVRILSPMYMRTRSISGLADRALAELPDLVRHRCECGSARGIAAELQDTETPHLVEHIALELMVERGASRTLRGRTTWDFSRDGKGVFKVSVGAGAEFGAPTVMAEECLRQGADLVNEWIDELTEARD